MAKQLKCDLCQSTRKLPNEVAHRLLDTRFGKLCLCCYTQKHHELSRQGYEERLARIAQRKLESENKAFNDFLETGKVTPIK